ncbi:MAG: nucleotide exchange factor GrpE [Planctomycetota bacterium]|jgi:molecular chaperone GrpE (heat shock protein)
MMFRKSFILSLVLLLAGGTLFGWAFTEQRKAKQQLEQHRERLEADLSKIDRVIGDEIDTRHFAGLVYDEDGRKQLDQYARQEEKKELAFTLSGVFTLTGGSILGWLLLVGSARGLVRGLSFVKGLLTRAPRKETCEEQPVKVDAVAGKEGKEKSAAKASKKKPVAAADKGKSTTGAGKEKPAAAEGKGKHQEPEKSYFGAWKQTQEQRQTGREQRRQEQQEIKSQVGRRSTAVVNSSRQNVEKNSGTERKKTLSQTDVSTKGKSVSESGQAKGGVRRLQGGVRRLQAGWAKNTRRGPTRSPSRSTSEDRIAMLLSDEESVKAEGPLEVQTPVIELKTDGPDAPKSSVERQDSTKVRTGGGWASSQEKAMEPKDATVAQTDGKDDRKNDGKMEESLKAQSEDLEKRMEEFKQMAQKAQEKTIQNENPVKESLKELTQQVSAIREYASHQQERVKKLQEGYDWNIIKNFCLRVIRCIDNLENRISRLAERTIDNTDLKEVRDELIFALESNGVEQFEPAIKSNYRGQEKNAEAVKEKEKGGPKLAGKIAKVLKPGYQYFIDEENVRVIRAAQVKLYG